MRKEETKQEKKSRNETTNQKRQDEMKMKKGNQKGDEKKTNKKRPGEEMRGSALCLQCTRLSNFGLVHSPTSTALHPSHAFSLLLRIPFQAGERNAACQRNGAEESGKGRGSERAALNISTQKNIMAL